MELCKYPEMGNVRTFHIEAIQIPIVYNQYGDYDPEGLLYVLEEDAERVRREALKRFEMSTPQPCEEVQPLVIRTNLGDTVKVRFRNHLDRRPSIHVQGLSYNVNTSDGASVGYFKEILPMENAHFDFFHGLAVQYCRRAGYRSV